MQIGNRKIRPLEKAFRRAELLLVVAKAAVSECMMDTCCYVCCCSSPRVRSLKIHSRYRQQTSFS
jgi:hypothetical protein